MCNDKNKRFFHSDGNDDAGFNRANIHYATGAQYDTEGYDQQGFNADGRNREGYDRLGYDPRDIHRATGNKYNPKGYDVEGYHMNGTLHKRADGTIVRED